MDLVKVVVCGSTEMDGAGAVAAVATVMVVVDVVGVQVAGVVKFVIAAYLPCFFACFFAFLAWFCAVLDLAITAQATTVAEPVMG